VWFGGPAVRLVGTQMIWPAAGCLPAQTYKGMRAVHATTMVLLALMPLSAAFFD